jgi:hypothetical protein
VSYTEIVESYQGPVTEADNGWPVIKPLLVPSEPDGLAPYDRIESLDLAENPDDLTYFDKEVLPKLREGFSKSFFVDPHPLLSGKDPLSPYYRNLRHLCDLLAQRADMLWAAGKKSEALEMLRLPLSLAKAVQSRPETVSVSLFSSAYASTALRDIADWASTNSLKEPELSQAAEMLAEYRPSYDHLVSSITVDFAQLDSSIKDEPTRTEVLGLGLAKQEDIDVWASQLRGLRSDALKLFGFQPVDPQTFNATVMTMSPQVQGLVLDYPGLTTMQKHAYATYLATELALALERHRLSGSKEPLDAGKLLDQTFGQDKAARAAAEAFLEYRPGQVAGSFALVGRGKVFQLAAPEGEVTFYQR